MLQLSDNDIKEFHALGYKVALKFLRTRIVVGDMLETEVASNVNLVITKCINGFKKNNINEFRIYFVMKILYMAKDVVRGCFGRSVKRRLFAQAQHMPFIDVSEHNMVNDLNISDETICNTIDKNRIIASLPTKQGRVLSLLRAGYSGIEIGMMMGGISGDRVSQIKSDAIKNAKKLIGIENKEPAREREPNNPDLYR